MKKSLISVKTSCVCWVKEQKSAKKSGKLIQIDKNKRGKHPHTFFLKSHSRLFAAGLLTPGAGAGPV